MSINFRRYRMVFLFAGLIVALGAVSVSLFGRSCSAAQQLPRPNEQEAVERLRAMTRNGVLPTTDEQLTRIEADYRATRAAGLARMLRARMRERAGDLAGAAALLDAEVIRQRTALGDYALWMRARALEQANRQAEARAAYEQLARDFPNSLRARESTLRGAMIAQSSGAQAAVPALVKTLTDADDAGALLLAAKAYEQQGDPASAIGAYRRIYFFAPASAESAEATTSLTRLSASNLPATPEEAIARADRLAAGRRHADALTAYTTAFSLFANTATPEAQLRRAAAAYQARRDADVVAAVNSIPTAAGETRAEAQHYLALTHARARRYAEARAVTEEMRRAFPQSSWTRRAMVGAGNAARDARLPAEAANFYRAAVAAFPGQPEVAGAQFELAWAAHDTRNFQESSRLLIEHLAHYANRNTDNRGRAGYWAARDAERAGQAAQAAALYAAMLGRYDANWYGYLAKQRLEALRNRGVAPADTPVGLLASAIANLQTVTVADETSGPAEEERITKADQLNAIGLDEWAFEELNKAAETAPDSPRVNTARARLHRAREENVQAINVLRRSYPDYSQMKPEEMSREVWDAFYHLAHWDIIKQEARARSLDPYTVAGLIRQESVFQTRAVSSARAYGLMQILVPTARLVAQRVGVGDRPITSDTLFEPRLNIQLGTAYMREQLDRFGRIEYMAAAYNAGPGRPAQWRSTLPPEIDEWTEAIPFRETRGYVQGVIRNTLQYRRLYDENGQFRPEVGSRVVQPQQPANAGGEAPAGNGTRPRRATSNEESADEPEH